MILKLCSNETRRLRANNGRDRTTVNFIFDEGRDLGTQWRRLVLIYRCVFTFLRGLITKPNRMKTRMKRRTRDSSQSGRQSIEEAVENDQFSKSSFGEVVRDLS